MLNLWKQNHSPSGAFRDGTYDTTEDNAPTVKGPWQVHVIGALPLRTISRIYGMLNEYTLPVWFRVPGYKFYSWVFGVNLDEMEPADLKHYRSLSEFFLRRLKPGVRPIADDYQLVSPADGRVVNFGYVENQRVEQVKGVSYSIDALLSGRGAGQEYEDGSEIPENAQDKIVSKPTRAPTPKRRPSEARPAPAGHSMYTENAIVDEQEFANVNGLSYTMDQLLGTERHSHAEGGNRDQTTSANPGGDSNGDDHDHDHDSHDASVPATSSSGSTTPEEDPTATAAQPSTSQPSLADQISLATQTFDPAHPHWTLRGVPKPGNRMFFCVVYLAPGDYHHFHSPTNWVVERRRHFAGELFSVSPYMTKLLKDLFVLNERVALLGRWRYGFFSMVPVGATNVGSIKINFDADLRTNSPTRPKIPGEYAEATYAKSSALLGGKPLRAGDDMGGFSLGSTIVLVFEAPEDFLFTVRRGDKVKVGEPLGDKKEKIAALLQEYKTREMAGQL